MEYIEKAKLMETLEKFKQAREAKKNCSKNTAMEYSIFEYIIKVVDTIPTVKVED